jgi:hypothetical protein
MSLSGYRRIVHVLHQSLGFSADEVSSLGRCQIPDIIIAFREPVKNDTHILKENCIVRIRQYSAFPLQFLQGFKMKLVTVRIVGTQNGREFTFDTFINNVFLTSVKVAAQSLRSGHSSRMNDIHCNVHLQYI